jgi:hypothetical protein
MSYLYPKKRIPSGELDQFLDGHYQKDTIFVGKCNTAKEYFHFLKNTF